MDLRALRYFVACVEHKTMHAAAGAVNVSQPALSKAIANLEQELGITLLDRHPRGVTITPSGDTLFRYAKMIDSDMRRALAEIDAQRGMTRGTIVIGVIPMMSMVMAKVIQTVLHQHPGLRLKLRVAFIPELIAALLNGEVDFTFAMFPEPGSEPPPGLIFDALLDTGLRVSVRADHPLTKLRRPSLRDLSQFQWLVPQYPPSHWAIIQRTFIDAGITPPYSPIDVSTNFFFGALVNESDMVMVAASNLPSVQGLRELVALETELVFPPEFVGLAFRKHSALLPGARAVIDIIKAHCAGMPGGLLSPQTA
jgi:LysR family transcriptional regulator of gallate degradation